MPVGFKNSTDGSVGIAVDACGAAKSGHCFLSVGKEGLSSIVETEGNPYTHIILRGGAQGPNYAAEHVRACGQKLAKAGMPGRIMVRTWRDTAYSFSTTIIDSGFVQIDCSHGNSSKQHQKQVEVSEDIVRTD